MSTSRHSSSDPEPPNVVRVKSRTSSPRLTVIWRSALAWFHAEISRTPAAHCLEAEAELGRERLEPCAGGVDVERDLAAEQVRRDAAEHDVGVGDGDVGAALAVAERPGVGARRARPDLERPLGRQPGDRAAAGADGDDVDHRDLARVDADRALGGQGRLAVDHDADVGRRTAAVAGQHPVEPGASAISAAPSAPAAGPDSTVVIGWCTTSSARQHAAVGLHHGERHVARRRRVARAGSDGRDVAREPRLDRRVDEGGHRPLVLAVLAQHLAARSRRRRRGAPRARIVAHPLLVRRVGVGVQEADAERGRRPGRGTSGPPRGRRPRRTGGSRRRCGRAGRRRRAPGRAGTIRSGLTQK